MRTVISLLSCIIISFFSIVAYSDDSYTEVSVDLVPFQIMINGEVLNNSDTEYPFLFYRDIVYIPTTYYANCFYGIRIEFYENKHRIFIGTERITEHDYYSYPLEHELSKNLSAIIQPENVWVNCYNGTNDFNHKSLNHPILNFRNVTYIPLSYDFACKKLDWKISFYEGLGLVVDTTEPNRPIIDKNHSIMLGATLPSGGVSNQFSYAYSENAYAAYPCSTLSYFYEFHYKKSGVSEQKYNIPLPGGDFYLNCKTTNGIDVIKSTIEPLLDANGILTIHCVVKNNSEGKYRGKNVIITVDMEKGKLIDIE